MNLFLSTTNLQQQYLDCCTIDVSETIERDCLSVLHKLHDQVNGLQLVQVVVQPLARLFNPASLAALVANVATSSNNPANSPSSTTTPSAHLNVGNISQAITSPIFLHHNFSSGSHNQDLDGLSTSTNLNSNSQSTHSRSQSFASAHIEGKNASATNNSSMLSSTSTYMMSPDTAQALIARLDTDRDVNWLMEIIGYGLSMPFSLTGEQDSVKDCCTIYCEWLSSSLLPYNEYNEDKKYQQLSKLVPDPIRNEPNKYARKMFSHLYNVFLPRQNININNSSVVSVINQKDQSEANLTAVSRQAVLCHRVLRTIESIAQNPMNLMDDDTWNHLLALLLTVNDKLLSCPTEPDDIGTQLHDRILGVLFDLMLLASAKSLPTRNLWKTFYEMCSNWRHRPALIDHWRRITLVLTKRVVSVPNLAMKCGNVHVMGSNLENTSPSSNMNAIEQAVSGMSHENLSQTWYRFLILIGNPVELSNPNLISRTEEFYHSACVSDNVLDPRQHPCLNVLPQVFLNSIVGLKEYIESFLGTYQVANEDQLASDPMPMHNPSSRGSVISLTNTISGLSSNFQPSSPQSYPTNTTYNHQQQPQAQTPTQTRRTGIKSMKGGKVIPFGNSNNDQSSSHANNNDQSKLYSINIKNQGQQYMQPRPSLTSISSRASIVTQQQNIQMQFKLFSDRPKCNSVLHVFGDWLFSAALLGSDLSHENPEMNDQSLSDGATSFGSSSTATEVSGTRAPSPSKGRKFSTSNLTASSKSTISGKLPTTTSSSKVEQASDKITLDQPLTVDSFEAGQAEAMAILCRIFSSKSSTEDIAPHYLSRFYLCLQHCLKFGSGQDNGQPVGPIKRQLLASVLLNSTNLLQKDLDGINLLIPAFIKAIEFIFECGDRDVPIQPPPRQHSRAGSIRQSQANSLNGVTNYDLRRACILTLLNLSAYPFHFKDLVIRNCLNESSPTTTFGSLRPRLLKLLFVAMQTETDPVNMQILFGGLSLAIHDLALSSDRSSSGLLGTNNRGDSMRSRKKESSTSETQESAKSSSEFSSSQQDDTLSQNSFVFDSKGGFIIKSLHVTCHLLINIWKHDTQVSLAALELLTTIARISTLASFNDEESLQKLDTNLKTKNNNNNDSCAEMRNEYKQTTKWICDYICNQCSRPPPAHSRDMHSTIVAAYQCLSIWFFNHPYLLNDQECVNTLMEVIELGVSGQKSKSLNSPGSGSSSSVIYKGDKIMKPSSMRVRDAAESLLNICMVRTRTNEDDSYQLMSSFDTVLDEPALVDIFTGGQYRSNIRQLQDSDLRNIEAYKMFKYYTDDDSVIFALLSGASHDPSLKDSVICLLRTPFGRHCWKMRFNYYTEKSRDKIIANKTQGLIKRPFSQCSTPSEVKFLAFPAGQNKSLYFNNTARFFPHSVDAIPQNDLDKLVTTLDSYVSDQNFNSKLKNDLEKIGKIFNHQVLAEQKVTNDYSIKTRRVECEEPQPSSELEAARIIVAHLGLQSSLSVVSNANKISASFISDLKSLDQQPVRICDVVSIFYVRKNRTTPQEILESVRERHYVSLSFFEWILELGEPVVVKNHSRWTGKRSSSWICKSCDSSSSYQMSKSQMLSSDHGGAIFDGDRMTLYWSDMCQELAFLVPHRIDNTKKSGLAISNQPNRMSTSSNSDHGAYHGQEVRDSTNFSDSPCPIGLNLADSQNSDVQSLCSVASDTSSQSTRTTSQLSYPRERKDASSQSTRDQKDSASLSRQSITTSKRKPNNSPLIGCDTSIIICWLESPDDIQHIPNDSLLFISERGYLQDDLDQSDPNSGAPSRSVKDYVRYLISPLKNGLFRINLETSFGKQWLALPLVDGMTVSRSIMSSLIRESILNLCRRRRLDADSYQPPHVRRRLKIQDICNGHRVSSRYDPVEFYNNIFRTRSP